MISLSLDIILYNDIILAILSAYFSYLLQRVFKYVFLVFIIIVIVRFIMFVGVFGQ